MIGGAAGVALGIPIGAYLYKEIGAVIGAAVLGVAGGMLGESVMQTAEE